MTSFVNRLVKCIRQHYWHSWTLQEHLSAPIDPMNIDSEAAPYHREML